MKLETGSLKELIRLINPWPDLSKEKREIENGWKEKGNMLGPGYILACLLEGTRSQNCKE